MQSILITGAAGYVGSVLTELMLRHGYRVIGLDNLMFGGESLLGVWHHPNFKFIKGDIIDSTVMDSVLRDHVIDAVVFLSAIVGDPACAKDPGRAKQVNLDGALTLLTLLQRYGVARFIFASTCSNYGKMSDPQVFIDETSPLKPVSLYAELKVNLEQAILERQSKTDSFAPTILRFATIYGVSPRMRFDLTVNEFVRELVMGRELEVYGPQFWRPYCHVFDIARAILLVLQSPKEKVAYNVFNVGDTKENYTKGMIVEEIKKYVQSGRVKFVHKDHDPSDYRVSFEKIKQELGFTITKRVPDGIAEVKYLVEQNVIPNLEAAKHRNS